MATGATTALILLAACVQCLVGARNPSHLAQSACSGCGTHLKPTCNAITCGSACTDGHLRLPDGRCYSVDAFKAECGADDGTGRGGLGGRCGSHGNPACHANCLSACDDDCVYDPSDDKCYCDEDAGRAAAAAQRQMRSTLDSKPRRPLDDPSEPPVPPGVTRRFTLVVGYLDVPYDNDDGRGTKRVIAVNGTSPGPEIRVNHGDMLEVTVVDTIGRLTTVHWHGFTQRNTPWADGVGGVSQCDVPGGGALVYKFRATLSGTFWYHAHFGEEYVDGLYGPLIVVARPEVYAADYSAEWVWQAADWYNAPARSLRAAYLSSANPDGLEPLPDAIAVNGRFSRQLAYTVERGDRVRVRFVNSAAFSSWNVSVDGVALRLIELDGQTIEPLAVPWVVVAVSQRVSFLLDLGRVAPPLRDSGALHFRVHALASTYPLGFAGDYGWQGRKRLDPLYVGKIAFGRPGNAVTYSPFVVPPLPHPAPDFNVINAKPLPRYAVPRPDHLLTYAFTFRVTPDGRNLAFVNGVHFEALSDAAAPTIFRVIDLAGVAAGAPQDLLSADTDDATEGSYDIGMNARSRFYVPLGANVQVHVLNYDGGPHPIHIHGHRFFVVGSSEVPGAEFENAPYYAQRDTAFVQASPDGGTTPGWLKLQFYANNPGVFLLHCHIDWHFAAGLAAMMIEGDEALERKGPDVPTPMLQVCGYHPKTPQPCAAAATCRPVACRTATCRAGLCAYDLVPDGAPCTPSGQCLAGVCAP